jgi:hypothetical protein
LTATPVTIVIGLEGGTSWSVALSPILIMTFIQFLQKLPSLTFNAFEQTRAMGGDPTTYTPASLLYWVYLLNTFVSVSHGLVFWPLVCAKVEGNASFFLLGYVLTTFCVLHRIICVHALHDQGRLKA